MVGTTEDLLLPRRLPPPYHSHDHHHPSSIPPTYIQIFRIWTMVDKGVKIRRMNMPAVEGGVFFLGQVFEMIRMPPWDLMVQWMHQLGPIYQFKLFGENCVVVADPALLKEVLHTAMRNFKKDLDFTYKPFMSLLGTGLVTSEGSLWFTQRAMVSAVFRIEILEIIPHIAKR